MTAMCISGYAREGFPIKTYGSRARWSRDPQSCSQLPRAKARQQPNLSRSYFVGLTTVTEPPKFRSLLCVAAINAAATAPPAASNRAARAPPLSLPNESDFVRRVQRDPGCAVPADSEVPAATAFVFRPALKSTRPPWEATIVLPHSTSTINVAA